MITQGGVRKGHSCCGTHTSCLGAENDDAAGASRERDRAVAWRQAISISIARTFQLCFAAFAPTARQCYVATCNVDVSRSVVAFSLASCTFIGRSLVLRETISGPTPATRAVSFVGSGRAEVQDMRMWVALAQSRRGSLLGLQWCRRRQLLHAWRRRGGHVWHGRA